MSFRLLETFAEVAEAFDGKPLPVRRTLDSAEEDRVGLSVDQTHVELVVMAAENEGATRRYLRMEAACSGAHELTMGLGRGLVYRALGWFQDVEIGVPDFDDEYVIRANDPELARLWLGPEVRRAYQVSPAYSMQMEHGLLTVHVRGTPRFEELESGLRATAALANRAYIIADELRAIARELDGVVPDTYWSPEEFVLTVVRGACQFRIDHVISLPGEPRRARGLRTRVRVNRIEDDDAALVLYHRDAPRARRPSMARDMRALSIDGFERAPWVAYASQHQDEAQRLAREMDLLERAAPESIAISRREVVLIIDGAPLHAPRLVAAVDLAHKLAMSGLDERGPYR